MDKYRKAGEVKLPGFLRFLAMFSSFELPEITTADFGRGPTAEAVGNWN